MVVRKVKPDELDIEIVRRLSLGFTTLQAGDQLGLGKWTVQDKVRRVKQVTNSHTLPQLVYWMHTNYYLWPQKRKKPTDRPDEVKIEIIQLRAWGFSQGQIQKKLFLNHHQYKRRIREAHRITRTRNDPHMISVCWSENFIV